MTNGVTPRRWLAHSNPGLTQLIDRHIGTSWRLDLDHLRRLQPLADDAHLPRRVPGRQARQQAAAGRPHLDACSSLQVDPDSLFDVQVKRIHEYKRQLLNLLHVVTRYHDMLADPQRDWVPRTVIFAGKAASSYHMAKQIIRLIHDVGQVINHDARLGGRLKLVFVPNYGVSVAEVIMPGADLSEQISTAGTEASGTGNMKLALNGALTIGTDDGANIEIRQCVGDDNIFIFGHRAHEVAALRESGYQPLRIHDSHPRLQAVLQAIGGGAFSPHEPARYRGVVDALLWGGDHYQLLADYDAYLEAQARVDALFREPQAWARAAVLNVAGMGMFSSDRTIREYAREIWHLEPQSRPALSHA